MKAFVYKTEFSDGRNDYCDLIVATDEDSAYTQVLNILKQIDEVGYGCDEHVSVEIIAQLATDPISLVEDIKTAYDA